MSKLICTTINDGGNYREYSTHKGNVYGFYAGIPTDVNDSDDVAFFLAAAGGSAFKKVNAISKVTKKIKETIPPKTDPEPKNIVTKEALFALNKSQQESIIKKLTTQSVPKLEKNKVKLLLKLQDEGGNVLSLMPKK